MDCWAQMAVGLAEIPSWSCGALNVEAVAIPLVAAPIVGDEDSAGPRAESEKPPFGWPRAAPTTIDNAATRRIPIAMRSLH